MKNVAKKILITGATAGIGRHAALELVRQGHHVIATGRREAALETLEREAEAIIQATGRGRLHAMRLDVTSEEDVLAAAKKVDQLTSGYGVDVLVNNAGFGQMGPVETVRDADLRRQFETNVFGLVRMTRTFVPAMRKRGAGRVINVGSLGGRVTFPFMGAYNSTKYAVESISDALRVELAPFGVDVSIVEPGPIRSEFNDRAMETLNPREIEGSPYAAVLARAAEFRGRFEAQSAGPEVTTAAITHAALARRPRVRYVVPFTSSLVLAVVAMLPTRLVDAVMRLAAGLTKSRMLPAAP
jgi:NAD(P)-dependent dehydrogenase (short-subunit alcohol dehydrogenase family)